MMSENIANKMKNKSLKLSNKKVHIFPTKCSMMGPNSNTTSSQQQNTHVRMSSVPISQHFYKNTKLYNEMNFYYMEGMSDSILPPPHPHSHSNQNQNHSALTRGESGCGMPPPVTDRRPNIPERTCYVERELKEMEQPTCETRRNNKIKIKRPRSAMSPFFASSNLTTFTPKIINKRSVDHLAYFDTIGSNDQQCNGEMMSLINSNNLHQIGHLTLASSPRHSQYSHHYHFNHHPNNHHNHQHLRNHSQVNTTKSLVFSSNKK
jgi:hypothetical protein